MRKILITIALIAVLITGCTKYYKVSDPLTGGTYYTTKIKKHSGGAVSLKDEKTGKTVTIQNSEVEKITKDEFKYAVISHKIEPAETDEQ